jgi:hypothetical protein
VRSGRIPWSAAFTKSKNGKTSADFFKTVVEKKHRTKKFLQNSSKIIFEFFQNSSGVFSEFF